MFAWMMFRLFLAWWRRGCCRRCCCCCWSGNISNYWWWLLSRIQFRLFDLMRKRKKSTIESLWMIKFTLESLDRSCWRRVCNERTSSSVNCIRSWSLGNKRILCTSNKRIRSIWWIASSRCCTARFFSCSSWSANRRLSSASRRQCSDD
jgi:hypothetical protein